MRSLIANILSCAFLTQAYAEEQAADRSSDAQHSLDDSLLDVLLDRALIVSPQFHTRLDETTLRKPAQATSRQVSPSTPHHSMLSPSSPSFSLGLPLQRSPTPSQSTLPRTGYLPQLPREVMLDHSARSAMTAVAAVGAADQNSVQVEKEVPKVLLLYPDDGRPGFAQIKHLGNTMNFENEEGNPLWPQAAVHLVKRVRWDLGDPPAVDIRALSLNELCSEAERGSIPQFQLVLGLDLSVPPPVSCVGVVQKALEACPERLFISSSPNQAVGEFWNQLTRLGGASADEFKDLSIPLLGNVKAALSGYNLTSSRLGNQVAELIHRRTAEEAVYAMLVLMDGVVRPLPFMRDQNPVPDNESLKRAIDKCKDEFQACFTTPKCLQTLNCISNCGLADQSCSYRCITSYQNDAFTQFSFCALQKQNIINSVITRPTTPSLSPMTTFRGAPLTNEVAEDILVGHFNPAEGRKYSWVAAAGSNPAYEQFPWQYQLFYKGDKGNFWYHPTFMVETLDGRKIWRERDYRVRQEKKVPGIWEFSVVDNGIVSEERWHLLGADDDLQWVVLMYIGAARKAGLAYRGCLVLTCEGDMPKGAVAAQGIAAAIERGGMKPWDLEACSNPPLDPSNLPPLIAPETQPAAPLVRTSPAYAR